MGRVRVILIAGQDPYYSVDSAEESVEKASGGRLACLRLNGRLVRSLPRTAFVRPLGHLRLEMVPISVFTLPEGETAL